MPPKRITRSGAAAWAARKIAKRIGLNANKQRGAATLARMASKAYGRGAYKYSYGRKRRTYNLSRGRTEGSGGRVMGGKGQTFKVTRSEYVSPLLTATGNQGSTTSPFNGTAYRVQPGTNAQQSDGDAFSLFTWLPAVAGNFQQYRFNKIIIEYRPTTSEGVSFNVGKVMMNAIYDNTEGLFSSERQILNSINAKQCRPCDPMLFTIECTNRKINEIRNLPLQTQTSAYKQKNINDFDHCILQITTSDVPYPDGSNQGFKIGDIFIHYDIELFKFKSPLTNSSVSGKGANAGLALTLFGSSPWGSNVRQKQLQRIENNYSVNVMSDSNGIEFIFDLESPAIEQNGEVPEANSWRLYLNNDEKEVIYEIACQWQGGGSLAPVAPPYINIAKSTAVPIAYTTIKETPNMIAGGPYTTNGTIDYNTSSNDNCKYLTASWYVKTTKLRADVYFSGGTFPEPSTDARASIKVTRMPPNSEEDNAQFLKFN